MLNKQAALKIGVVAVTFRTLSGLSAQTADEWLIDGYRNDSLGEFRKSVECYTQVLKEENNNEIALYNRSVAYINLKKANLALVDLNKLIALDQTLPNAYYNRYALYYEFGNYEFAMGDINKYIELSPKDLQAKLMRAELAVKMEYYDVALSDLKDVIEEEGSLDLQIALAEVYAMANHIDSASELLSKLSLKADIEDEHLYLVNAIILSKSGKYSESNQKLNLVLLNSPNERGPLKLKADNLFYLKQYEDALALYKKLIEQDSNDYALWTDIGHCYLQLELYSEALEVLSKSVRKRNAHPAYAYLGRGIAYYNLKKFDKACGDWQKSALLGNDKAKEYLKNHCVKEEIDE